MDESKKVKINRRGKKNKLSGQDIYESKTKRKNIKW